MTAPDAARRRPLQPEHEYVWDALRVATLGSGGAATVRDVVQALPKSHAAALRAAYANDLSTAVSKILQQLVVRGLVTSPGRAGRQRHYALPGAPAAAGLPAHPPPRRQRVLALVRAAVTTRGGGVLATEIVAYAASDPAWADLTPTLIIRDLQNLVRTRALVVLTTVRGGEGRNVYLPNEPAFAALSAAPADPSTWLELVGAAALAVWEGRVAEARARGARPAPFTTAEVRARLESAHPSHERLRDPRSIANALIQLAGGRRQVVRHVRQKPGGSPGDHAVGRYEADGEATAAIPTRRWAPAHVRDEALGEEPVYASDAERLVAAVRRASQAGARAPGAAPRPVSASEVAAVIAADPALALRGRTSVALALADLAKRHVDMGAAGRAVRAVQRVWRVGRIDGRPVYAASHVAEARARVVLENAAARWAELQPTEQLEAAAGCPSRALAVGRVLLLAADLDALRDDLGALLAPAPPETGSRPGTAAAPGAAHSARTSTPDHPSDPTSLPTPAPDRPTREDAEQLAAEVEASQAQAAAWLVFRGLREAGAAPPTGRGAATEPWPASPAPIPPGVVKSIPAWTVEEYLAQVLPLYPRAATAATRDEVIRLVQGSIRRVPNPEHVRRRDPDPRGAAELLFDRADALLDAARRWGGPLLRTRAAAVRHALGRLRDPAFAAAALREPGREARLLGAGALAFLAPADAGAGALRDAASDDRDPAVRQVACWALGFLAFTAGRAGDVAWVAGRASEDQDARVRHAVQDMLRTQRQAGPRGWWAV